MNPCRCGHLGDPALACSRAPKCAADYQSRVSGPLLDRIDLHVEVEPVSARDLALPPPGEGSAEVAARVRAARAVQTARLEGTPMRNNAALDGEALDRFATPDEAGRKLLMEAADRMRLSARGFTRLLRVARTIADLAGAEHDRPRPCRRGAELSQAGPARLIRSRIPAAPTRCVDSYFVRLCSSARPASAQSPYRRSSSRPRPPGQGPRSISLVPNPLLDRLDRGRAADLGPAKGQPFLAPFLPWKSR